MTVESHHGGAGAVRTGTRGHGHRRPLSASGVAALSPRLVSISLALLCLAVAAYAHAQRNDVALLKRANELGLRGDFAGAGATAARVGRGPAATEALLVEAYAAFELRDYATASAEYSAAARRDPHNWIIRRDWAAALARHGAARHARRELAVARKLNPRLVSMRGVVR